MSEENNPRITVVIPTRNAGPRFAQTLEAIARQELAELFAVLVMDSGSRDGTLALCRARGVRVLSIPPATFGHGRTRNQAAAACLGEYIAFTVQDAVPADAHWLRQLVAALDDDPGAAGAYARTLPHVGAGFIARQASEYWHRLHGQHTVQRLGDWDAFQRLAWEEKQLRCTFNNVSSIVRRAVWEQIPFRNIPFAEDLAWGYDCLRAGYGVVYAPEARVYHSHERPWSYELRRAYVESKIVGELFAEPAWPLSVEQLGALAHLARRVLGESAAMLDQAPDDPTTWLAAARGALRRLYRQRFTRQTLKRIFGSLSPLAEAEQAYLYWNLVLWREQIEGRHVAFEAHVLDETTQPPYRRYLNLEKCIKEAVWAEDERALSAHDLDFIFDNLWDGLGLDVVRGAVLAEAVTEWRDLYPVELRLRHFACDLAARALEEQALNARLYREIVRHAVVVNVGRRLGAANRYGAGGRWGQLLEHWWAKGI